MPYTLRLTSPSPNHLLPLGLVFKTRHTNRKRAVIWHYHLDVSVHETEQDAREAMTKHKGKTFTITIHPA